jgi:cell envelope opacity-associated protein A
MKRHQTTNKQTNPNLFLSIQQQQLTTGEENETNNNNEKDNYHQLQPVFPHKDQWKTYHVWNGKELK